MKARRIARQLLTAQLTFLLLLLWACQPNPPDPPQDDEWPLATPESQGLDGRVLERYSELAAGGGYGAMRSFLVVRHGCLVHEAYYQGYDRERLHPVYSVTKTVAAILVGMALDRGEIADLRQKVLSFFPQYPVIAHMDDRKAAITIADLLTMRAGLRWDEESTPSDSEQNSLFGLYNAPDWYRYILDQPMAAPPGTVFAYNSGCSVLLGGILSRSCSAAADLLAQRDLFAAIGVREFEWREGSPGVCNTGWGLWLRPRDMGKIGELLLRSGSWQGKRVIPSAWVQAMLSCQVVLGYDYGYGYQVWMLPLRPQPAVNGYEIKIAWGYGGQFIFVIPGLDMVVVATAGNFMDDGGAIDFIQEMLAAAVQGP